MTEQEKKSEEIINRLKTHEAMIESLKAQLKENKSNAPYGPMRKAWLVTMKACTAPFAAYNKDINAYMANPDVYKLEKDINKLQEAIFKVYENLKSYKNEKRVIKALLKLSKIEQKVLANPAYISQKYEDSMNVKETLEEVSNAKTFLSELLIQLKPPILPNPGLEKVSNPA